jgi:hypothetical protein
MLNAQSYASIPDSIMDVDLDDLLSELRRHQEDCTVCSQYSVCDTGQRDLNRWIALYVTARRETLHDRSNVIPLRVRVTRTRRPGRHRRSWRVNGARRRITEWSPRHAA